MWQWHATDKKSCVLERIIGAQHSLSPVLFALAIDWVMRTALTGLDVGQQWTEFSRLSDLDYADDIVLLETSRDRMQQLTDTVETEGKKIGL